jgi:DNA-binding beta-propeller fold protein YncE/DNA-directed RNA polymerase subunit RPC12/RpoP
MAESFNCPNCNASLELQSGDGTVIQCQYCNSSVIVPEALRSSENQENSAHALAPAEAQALSKIEGLLNQGRKVEAVKLYRETFGGGLKEAKKAVDELEAGHSIVISKSELAGSTKVGTRWGWLGCVLLSIIVAGTIIVTFGSSLAAIFATTSIPVIGVLISDVLDEEEDPIAAIGSELGIQDPTQATTESSFARPVLVFGSEGTGPGQFDDVRNIIVDPDGRIYVGEYNTGRVYVFDDQGQFITQWSLPAGVILNDMDTGRDGTIYLAYEREIHRHDGLNGEDQGVVPYDDDPGFEKVHIAPDGSMLAYYGRNANAFVRFDRSGQVNLFVERPVRSQTGEPANIEDIARDGLGNVYALDSFSDLVFIFDRNGKYINRFGGKGDQPGQLSSPRALSADGQGHIYVGDSDGVQVFDSHGRYLHTIEGSRSVFSMDVDDQDNLYVLDRNDAQVTKYQINP